MIRRPPRSTLFPTRRSSDLSVRPSSVGITYSPTAGIKTRSEPATMPGKDCGTVMRRNARAGRAPRSAAASRDRKSTRLNSSHDQISYAVFCLKKKKNNTTEHYQKLEHNNIRSQQHKNTQTKHQMPTEVQTAHAAQTTDHITRRPHKANPVRL